uniref:Uncharacterized protein n=2 Tax=Sipha flava TaxID=143950 RepID=A0A2S2QJ59_9HEMI
MNPIDIASQVISKNDSQEEKENICEKLTQIGSSSLADKEVVKKEENQSVNPASNYSSHLIVKDEIEKITDSSTVPPLTIDSLVFPINELVKEDVDTLKKNPVDIYSHVLSKSDSQEKKKELSNRSTESISQVLTIDELFNKEESSFKNLNSTDKPIIPIKEIEVEEIESFIEISTGSDLQHPPKEELLKFENRYIIENSTKTHKISVEEQTKEKIDLLPLESLINKKIENIPESVTVTNNASFPVEYPENNEVRIIHSKLITSDNLEVQLRDTSTIEKEIISNTIMEYGIPTVTPELKNEIAIEMINCSYNPNNQVDNTNQIDIPFIETNSSITSTVPIKSENVKKLKVSANLISTENVSRTMKKSMEEEVNYLFENLTLNAITDKPIDELLCIEKEILHKNLIRNETSVITEEEKLETKKENVISELLISSNTLTIPDEDVVKDKIESLNTTSIPHSIPTQLKRPTEINKENVHLIVHKTKSLNLPIEESIVKNIDNLTIKPINIGSQVILAKGLLEEEKENLSPADFSIISNEETGKEKIENLPENIAQDNLSLIPIEGLIKKLTDSSSASLITTKTPPRQIKELNTSTTILDDFVPTPLEEVIKENISTVKPLHVEQKTLTNTETEIITQVLLKDKSMEIKKDNLSEHLHITGELIEQSSKDIKTLPTDSTLDNSLPTLLETSEEKNEVESVSIMNVIVDLPTVHMETVSEPKEFELKLSSDFSDIKQFNTNQVLISDITKSLSVEHSSCESIDDKLEEENIIEDHFNIEFIDSNQHAEIVCEQNDIAFKQLNSVTASNDEENKQYDEHSDDSDTVTSYCNKKTVNIEKTNSNYQSSIDDEVETENSGVPNSFQGFGETSSAMLHSETESGIKEKSFGIQKLEMSVHRVKTTDDDYFEKTFVQLEQTEKITMGENVTEGDNKTAASDKLYTVNESDLNAILCASSLQEALTLLDSKIKFKFKHGKKKNSVAHKSNIQTSSNKSSGKSINFAEAREYFKTIEKKSKK